MSPLPAEPPVRLVYDRDRDYGDDYERVAPGDVADAVPPPAAYYDEEPAAPASPAAGEPGVLAEQTQETADAALAWMARLRDWLRARRADIQRWAGDGKSTAVTRDGVSIWDTQPPSLRQLAAHTRAGGWMPGDKPPLLEFAGFCYGWAVAVTVTAAAYLVLHVIQRPGRLALAVAVVTIVILAY